MPATAPTVSSAPPLPASKSALVSKRKQRRALDLIAWLQPLRLAYPEFDAILEGSIEDLEHEAARNPEADRQIVLTAIHSGLWSITDLLEELPIKRKQLQAILDPLVAAGILLKKTPEVRSDLGGRPEALYLPAPNTPRK